MAKPAPLTNLLDRKGAAQPPADAEGRAGPAAPVEKIAPTPEPSKPRTRKPPKMEAKSGPKPPAKEVTKEPSMSHLWKGKDAPTKLSVDVPERIAIKLSVAKGLRLFRNQKGLVAEVLEAKLDELLAQHEKDAAGGPKQAELPMGQGA